MHLSAGVSISLMLAIGASAQQPADGTIRIHVRQVVVPVVVTDKKGHSVNGLPPSDFQIVEDGVPQDIVAFTREVASSPVTSSAVNSGTAGVTVMTTVPKQKWVICVDALHTSVASFVRAKEAIDKLLSNKLRAEDPFVLLSVGRQLRVIQPATNDVNAVRAKVNSKEFANLAIESDSQQLSAAVNDVRRRMDLYCTGCACGRDASNRRSTCDVELQQIRQELNARSEQFGMYDHSFFAQFKSVIEELAKLDGRRNLILISDGFTLMPGRELFATAGAYLPNSPYFKFDPERNMQTTLEQSLKAAAGENVIISAIDARGSYTPAARPGGLLDSSNAAPGSTGRQEVIKRGGTNALRGGSLMDEIDSKWRSVEFDNGSALSQLAKASGGLYFHDDNDLQKGLREALDDNRETYVIAYVPKNSTQDGKFRQITVTVNSANPKAGPLTIRAKSGYWAENAAIRQ